MFYLSISFLPLGICLFLLILFILYRVLVLKKGKPFFPILAVLMILAVVPYSSEYKQNPVENGPISITPIPVQLTANGDYLVFESKGAGTVIGHLIPAERTNLMIDDTKGSTLTSAYFTSHTDYYSIIFTYAGTTSSDRKDNEFFTITVHTSQIPSTIKLPTEASLSATAPVSETVTPGEISE